MTIDLKKIENIKRNFDVYLRSFILIPRNGLSKWTPIYIHKEPTYTQLTIIS